MLGTMIFRDKGNRFTPKPGHIVERWLGAMESLVRVLVLVTLAMVYRSEQTVNYLCVAVKCVKQKAWWQAWVVQHTYRMFHHSSHLALSRVRPLYVWGDGPLAD